MQNYGYVVCSSLANWQSNSSNSNGKLRASQTQNLNDYERALGSVRVHNYSIADQDIRTMEHTMSETAGREE